MEQFGDEEVVKEIYAEYAKFSEITRQRLFYETVSQVFPGMKVIIMGKTNPIRLSDKEFSLQILFQIIYGRRAPNYIWQAGKNPTSDLTGLHETPFIFFIYKREAIISTS